MSDEFEWANSPIVDLAVDAAMDADDLDDALKRMETLETAARRALDHLRFNAWKNDPNSDKRFAAVEELREALGATSVDREETE